jgi:chorismate synthase
MSSSFGTLFRVTTFGESHGQGVGAVIDGCPPKTPLDETDIQPQLDRRRPAQSKLTTTREEADRVSILSGVQNGKTLGTPIALMVKNKDQKYLSERYGIEIVAWVSAVYTIEAPSPDLAGVSRQEVDRSAVRCPDLQTAEKMQAAIVEAQEAGDSVGGTLTCVCRNIPAGLGEPVFNKMEALLAQAMLSIPATKGFEIGSGFAGSRMRGSAHNDVFIKKGAHLGTRTNYSGGVQGGISNGEPLIFRVAFKPPATISMPQKTVDFEGNATVLEAKGRHDPCVVPRAVPIVESMAALVLADLALQQKMRENETV